MAHHRLRRDAISKLINMHLIRGLIVATTLVVGIFAASLTKVTNFGSNPTSIDMYIYVPDKVATRPAVIVALHYCGGTAQAYYSGTKLPSYADKNGFIIVYPSTSHDSNCWDVSTKTSLTHNAGGDSYGIISMVNYTLTKYSGDPSKVFALGSSSGAMMTNLLAGAYPDVFAGGASFSGIPYACMEGSPSSSPGSGDHSCPDGKVQKTGQQWVDRVHQGYPGYNGTYPKMALFHGTADTLVTYQCLIEQVKQWTAMNNVSFTRNVTNTPSSGFTESIYGDGTKVLAFTQAGGGHVTPFQEETVLKFFSLI